MGKLLIFYAFPGICLIAFSAVTASRRRTATCPWPELSGKGQYALRMSFESEKLPYHSELTANCPYGMTRGDNLNNMLGCTRKRRTGRLVWWGNARRRNCVSKPARKSGYLRKKSYRICQLPKPPKNGFIYNKPMYRRDPFLLHGEYGEFGCEAGYYMHGPSRVYCRNGRIVDRKLGQMRCRKRPPKTAKYYCNKLKHFNIENKEQQSQGEMFQYTMPFFYAQSKIFFSCQPGTMMRGTDKILCYSNGTWSGKAPDCLKNDQITCGTPPLPPKNGKITGYKKDKVFKPGMSVRYSCKRNFYLVGQTEVRCLNNGEWNIGGGQTKCQKLSYDSEIGKELIRGNVCGTMEDQQAKLKQRSQMLKATMSFYTRGAYKPVGNGREGNVLQFSCSSDSYMLAGPQTIYCVEGEWPEEFPECVLKPTTPSPCDIMPKPTANMIVKSQEDKTVEFACEKEFDLVGSGLVTCKDNEWTNSDGQFPYCKLRMRKCGNQVLYGRREDEDDGSKGKRLTTVYTSTWLCIQQAIHVATDINSAAPDISIKKKTKINNDLNVV